MFNNNDDDFNKKEEDKTPPEGLILFAMIGIILGGTLILNFIVSLFIQL
tara:strand:+ start:381 stop:527 length:147 start_codon:yes stop_codon:yes gene_type:complete